MRKGADILYKTIIVPLKCNKTDFEYLKKLNKISADVWNYVVNMDMEYTRIYGKAMGLSELEFNTKQKFRLHANGIQHIVFKYYYARDNMWKSRKARHKNSKSVMLPYKEKKFLPTGWGEQFIHVDYDKNIIRLSAIKSRKKQIRCHVKSIPKNIVEIELVYKDKYYLSIKYKEENINILIQSNNSASIDFGEIHAITSIDNNKNCIIITNRKIRSLIRLKDKRQGEIQSLRSKCMKHSKKYKKYTKTIWKIKFEFDRKINDCIHKMTKLYLEWCIKNNICKIYYGNLDSVTRNSKGRLSKKLNHKLNMWRFGQTILQLNNKLSRYGIELIKVSEAYSSQNCPSCNKHHKTISRNYLCKCGYTQHRDIVGAINILNSNTTNHLQKYDDLVYLRIA